MELTPFQSEAIHRTDLHGLLSYSSEETFVLTMSPIKMRYQVNSGYNATQQVKIEYEQAPLYAYAFAKSIKVLDGRC